MISTSYLEPVVDHKKLPKTIAKIVKILKSHADKFDSIAFRGMSGALVSPIVAMKLKKGMLMVRKPDSHSSWKVEGSVQSSSKYVIVDDQISTGGTIEEIVNKIDSVNKDTKLVGIALYHQSADEWTIGEIKRRLRYRGIDMNGIFLEFTENKE